MGTCCVTAVGQFLPKQKVMAYLRVFQIKATRKRRKEGHSFLFQLPLTFYTENGNVEKGQTIPGIGLILMFTEREISFFFLLEEKD